MKASRFYVYLLTTSKNTVLYIGVTNDLTRRVIEHKQHRIYGFTADYNVNKLVYYESFEYNDKAIRSEKQLKKWNRVWKNQLIATHNPDWHELAPPL